MNVRTQQGLMQVWHGQVRRATRPILAPEVALASTPEDSAQAPGAGNAISLSDAMMRSWAEQVASRRLLASCLAVPRQVAVGDMGDMAEDAAIADAPWNGSLAHDAPGRPPGVALTSLGRHMLRHYARSVASQHSHSDEPAIPGGAIVVDLDEAVHGGYAAVKDAKVLINEGWDAIQREYQEVARDWIEAPLEAAQHAVVPAVAMDLGVSLGVGLPLAVLAWKAAREGYEAVGEARATESRLVLRGKSLEVMRDELHRIMRYVDAMPAPTPMAPLVEAVERGLLLQTQTADDVRVARQHNRMAGQIGWASMVSGASILGKVAVAAPLSAGFTAANAFAGTGLASAGGVVAQSTAASIAATAGGIATTALSFPAAAGAIGLGVLFARKSALQQRQFRVRNLPTRTYLSDVRAGVSVSDSKAWGNACTRRYCDFVLTKSKLREKFYRVFSRMNRGFLAGSVVYGAGAVGSGIAIAVAAAAGLSNPVGWAVLAGLGTLGGVVMAANSLQFLRGHHRQQRYDAYLERDDPELDREFLAAADIMSAGAEGAANNRRGVDLRARFYDMLMRRDNHRQAFLRGVAADLGCYHVAQAYSTDDATTRSAKKAEAPTLLKRLGALVFKRGGRFLPWRRGGFDLRTGLADLRAHGRRGYRALSVDGVRDWLRDPANRGAQVDFMSRALGEQSRYLRHKLALRQEILDNTVPQARDVLSSFDAQHATIDLPGMRELEAVYAAQQFLGRHDQGAERDSLMLSEVMLLESELAALRRANHCSTERMALLKQRFLSLSSGRPYDPHAGQDDAGQQVDQAFAHWAVAQDGAAERMRHLRGMLVDVEMQATELRELGAALEREVTILAQEDGHHGNHDVHDGRPHAAVAERVVAA